MRDKKRLGSRCSPGLREGRGRREWFWWLPHILIQGWMKWAERECILR